MATSPSPPEKKDGGSPSQPSSNVIRRDSGDSDNTIEVPVDPAGVFRGIAAATRKLLAVKSPAMKSAIRSIGQNRPLAFASEGAVAGASIIPRVVYYGAWTLSGVAISADIYTKYDDAPTDRKWHTVGYWTAFHIPASLVVPAVIIHQVVHTVEEAVQKGTWAKSWSPRAKSMAPVAAALLSIGPVVPVVDTVAEMIMEPTLGTYLGLEFDHHGHDSNGAKEVSKPKEN